MVPVNTLMRELFKDGLSTCAVIDGAQVPELPQRLESSGLEHVCLYRGEIPDDLAQVAPYLVRLKYNHEFTKRILEQGWGHAWCIYVSVDDEVGFHNLRKHFRTFLKVEHPDGGAMNFRYYDPRIMRLYLPTCNAEEQRIMFGSLHAYMMEGDAPDRLLSFESRNVQVIVHSIFIV